MGRLDGKVAIITGGASGIGEGTVKLFVGHGAKVVIADVQDQAGERIARELGENVVYQHTDVSKEADIEAMINLAASKFGRLDCLFNNAGFGGVSGEIDQIELGADYDATIGVMFTGVMLGMKHSAKIMKQQKSGSIISTASVAAIQGGLGPHVYSGIKAGVIGLTQSVALELAAFGVRVNAICPGGIATPIFAPMLEELPSGDNEDTATRMRPILAATTPIGRSGEPDDIGHMAVFLASDDSTFVTGQHLLVDGGLCSMHFQAETGGIADLDLITRAEDE